MRTTWKLTKGRTRRSRLLLPNLNRAVTARAFKYLNIGNYFIFSNLLSRPTVKFGFCCPLTLLFGTLSSNSIHRHRELQNSLSLLLASSDTVCILSMLLFFAIYINIIYLLDPQLPACRPITLDSSHKPPGRLSQLCCFAHVNGVHSHKCSETWMLYSVYVGTQSSFLYALRKRLCLTFGLRLSPKRNTYTAWGLPKKSSVSLPDYLSRQWEMFDSTGSKAMRFVACLPY